MMLMPMFTAWGSAAIGRYPTLDGETARTTKLLYNGVTRTNIKTSRSSKYDLQNFNIVEFDLSQTDLYVDVTNERNYLTSQNSTLNTVTSFNSSNGEGKTAIAAINGDLWTMSSAHARIEGKGTSYNGYSDAVVTGSMTLPRGFTIYDGEIVCSSQIEQETPYEGDFWSFGVSDGYVPMIGRPELEITVTDKSINKSVEADGLNRLPANNALVVYSDKGCSSTKSLADAYEIVIDCDNDYTIKHGASITGTVTGIYSAADPTVNPTMTANRIILTARGTALSKLAGFEKGHTVTLDFSVYERYGRNTEGWQTATCAVGGQMPFVVDGVKWETNSGTNYPSTIVGIKNDGNVVFIVNDGRQSSFSTGLDFNDYWDFADDMDLNTAFILDGGGSANLIESTGTGYSIINSPSDGSARNVSNSVILSAGPRRRSQDSFTTKVPSTNIDLTKINFATDDGAMLLTNFAQTKYEKTKDGIKLIADDFFAATNASISFGLPNTTSYNPYSVIKDKSYPYINASDYPYMVIDAAVVSADSSIIQFQALYHTAGSHKASSQSTFIGFNNAYNNSGFNKYKINPGANSTYKGRLNTLRYNYLYVANGVNVQDGDYVILRNLYLAKNEDEANAVVNGAVPSAIKTVNFNANGGRCDQSVKYAEVGSAYGVMPVPVKEGSTFKGWFTSDGVEITEDTAVTDASDLILYARWEERYDPEAPVYKLTFDLNGGTATGINAYYDIRVGQLYSDAIGALRTPVRNGYRFNGWLCISTGYTLDMDDIHMVDGDRTFVAQWEAKGGSYKANIDVPIFVIVDGKATHSATIPEGEIIEIAAENIDGIWATVEYNGVVGVAQIELFTYVDELLDNLYWEPLAQFTVNFNGAWYNRGAAISHGNVTTTNIGIEQTNVSGLENVEIYVYNRVHDKASVNINDGNYFGVLYVNGTQVGGFPDLGSLMYVLCRSLVRDSHSFVKISNEFFGDFTIDEMTSAVVDNTLFDGSSYTFDIQWEPQVNKLYLDPNGGELSEEFDTEYTFYGDQRFNDIIGGFPVPVREGYDFAGWKNTLEGTSDCWTGGWGTQPFTFGSDITLEAQWIERIPEGTVVKDGDSYYLEIEGERAETGMYSVDGDYYYVKRDGALACDETIYTYNSETLPKAYYRFEPDCRMMKNGWLDLGDGRVFYFEGGAHASGLTKIGADYYFFELNRAQMCTDSYIWVGENEYDYAQGVYYFGEDGVLDLMYTSAESVPVATVNLAIANNSGLDNYIQSTEVLAVNTAASVALPETAEDDGDGSDE